MITPMLLMTLSSLVISVNVNVGASSKMSFITNMHIFKNIPQILSFNAWIVSLCRSC